MTDRFIVYALSDPRTNLIRYIGKSSVGLARPRSHFEPKRIATDRNLHKARWMQGLAAVGLLPSISILERCDAHGRAAGWPLTNLTDGGDGTAGLVVSAETRAKMSAFRKGKKRPPEMGAKISAKRKGKPNPSGVVWWQSLSDGQKAAWAETSRVLHTGDKRPDLADRNRTPEMRAIVRRPRSEETKKKMSEAALRRHARERGEVVE